MNKKIIVKSTNPEDTPQDIEEKLEKAVESIKLQREKKKLPIVYLQKRKAESDRYVKSVLDNMINEISKILNE